MRKEQTHLEAVLDLLNDPISCEVLDNPVVASDGYTYSWNTFSDLMADSSRKNSSRPLSPFTREPLSRNVVPNRLAASLVEFVQGKLDELAHTPFATTIPTGTAPSSGTTLTNEQLDASSVKFRGPRQGIIDWLNDDPLIALIQNKPLTCMLLRFLLQATTPSPLLSLGESQDLAVQAFLALAVLTVLVQLTNRSDRHLMRGDGTYVLFCVAYLPQLCLRVWGGDFLFTGVLGWDLMRLAFEACILGPFVFVRCQFYRWAFFGTSYPIPWANLVIIGWLVARELSATMRVSAKLSVAQK